MRLFIDYKTTNEPWGGINTFFKNFIECSENYSDVITLVNDYRLADVILFGANSRGVKAKISANDILNYGNSKAVVIHRLDGLRRGFDSFVKDTESCVDGYVFQSKKGLEDYNFIKKPSAIIHNGVNQNRYWGKMTTWRGDRLLKCLFVSWSDSIDKGFIEYANISTGCAIECTFVGRWRNSVDSKYVKLIEPKENNLLPEIYRNHDVLIFLSKLESCSNVVLEALASGLPIVYYKGSGVEEIVGTKYGVPVDTLHHVNNFYPLLKKTYNELEVNIQRDINKFSMKRTIEEYLKFFEELKLR